MLDKARLCGRLKTETEELVKNFPGVYDSVTIAFHHQLTFNSNISHCYRLLGHISLKTSSTDALFPSSAEQHFELNVFFLGQKCVQIFLSAVTKRFRVCARPYN